jgi:IPT/TIG domain
MYEHAFRVQSNLERQTLEQENLGSSGSVFQDFLQLRFQVTKEQFSLFSNSALRFDRADQDMKRRILAVAEMDRATHPNTRVLSENARMKINSLFAERLRAASDEVAVLHQILGATTAQQLDDKVEKFYAESPRNIASINAAIDRIARNGLGIAHGANTAFYPTLSTAKPLDSDPGGSNCQFVPTDYEEVYANECYDDGGDYNFSNCQCTGGSGDGDGGGTDPLPGDYTPIIAGIAPSSWTAGTTTQVTFSGQYFGTNAPTLSFSPGSGIVYTLLSYSDTQIVASIKIAAGTPNESVGVSVTNNGYGGNAFSNPNGPESPTSFPVTATVLATCFAQLKYRAVYISGANSGRNHSFWYIQDQYGDEYIIDAGPSGSCPFSCGYLNAWITPGTVSSHYNTAPSLDSSTAATAWSIGPSSGQLCTQVQQLENFALDWEDNATKYVLDGAPNSNTFTHEAGTAAGFTTMTPPPSAPGW